MQEENASFYDYGFWRRNVFVWLLMLVLLWWAWIGVTEGPPEKIRTWGYWIGNMTLVMIVVGTPTLFAHRRRLRSCRPIAITDRAVVFAPRSEHEQTIAWTELERVERVSLARAGEKKGRIAVGRYGGILSGLRLVAGDREIPILRSIRRYKDLRREIEARCRARGIPFDAPE